MYRDLLVKNVNYRSFIEDIHQGQREREHLYDSDTEKTCQPSVMKMAGTKSSNGRASYFYNGCYTGKGSET